LALPEKGSGFPPWLPAGAGLFLLPQKRMPMQSPAQPTANKKAT